MRRSTVIAVLIALAVVAWLASPLLGVGPGPADDAVDSAAPAAEAATGERLTAVRTRTSRADPVTRELVLNGRTEADRVVDIAAEVSGRVVELLHAKGQWVEAGELLVRLDRRDREAALEEARATLEQRRIEYEAASRLGERGFQAETRVAEARATLESARYQLKRAEVALSQSDLFAPFSGVLEAQHVELGSFVDVGELVLTIVDLDPIVVVTDVPEASISRLAVGDAAEIRIVDDNAHTGRVRFVARRANEQTRTFRVEIAVANPASAIPAGISTEVSIASSTVEAHRVSPGVLVLADNGVLGVKSVDDDARVRFHPAEIVRAEADAVWLGGLPERLELITVGQGFVSPGQRVRATDEADVSAILESGAPLDGRSP